MPSRVKRRGHGDLESHILYTTFFQRLEIKDISGAEVRRFPSDRQRADSNPRQMLRDVQAGDQRVIFILGEAGVGKSRLVEELGMTRSELKKKINGLGLR